MGRTLVGLAIIFGLFFLAVAIGGNAIIFINLPAFVLVAGLTFGGAVFSHGPPLFFRAIGTALRQRQETVPAADAARYAHALGACSRYAIAAGVVGTIIGLVQMMSQLNDPAHLGPAMAVCLMTGLYGVVASEFVFLPLANRLSDTYAADTAAMPSSGARWLPLGILGGCLVASGALLFAVTAPDTTVPPPKLSIPEITIPESSIPDISLANIGFQRQRHFFMDNEHAGRLLVVEGEAVNNYPEAKEFIKLAVTVRDDAGHTLAKQFLAGNLLSLFQLKMSTPEEIEANLADKVGILTNNTMVAPGMKVPYMAVFPAPEHEQVTVETRAVDAKNPPRQ